MASLIAPSNGFLGLDSVQPFLAESFPAGTFQGKKVLLIVPDSTRTAPVGWMFQTLFKLHGKSAAAMDVMIALGTHQPMSEEAICQRLEISLEERKSTYASVSFFNHQWDRPEALKEIGVITKEEIHAMTEGRFSMDVPVRVNKNFTNTIKF